MKKVPAIMIAMLAALASPALAQTALDVPASVPVANFTAATFASGPPAQYPMLSHELHEEGTTQLALVVNVDGTVGDAAVAKSSGSERLDAASLDWVRLWLYHPATKDGQPVASTQRVNIRWTISSSGTDSGGAAEKFVMKREDFPSGTWDANESGTCEIILSVDTRGSVADYRAIKGSGFADLDAAAKEFLTRHWHTTPAIFDGKPVWTYIPVEVIWSHDAAASN